MANSVERRIIRGSAVALAILTLVLVFKPNLEGFVTSDGSYKSPASDESYVSPKSDDSYESPVVGEGYIAPKIDESWDSPESDESYESPTTGPGFVRPEAGPGFVSPGGEPEDDFIVTNQTTDKPAGKPKKIELGKLPKGPIDEKYVGGWRPYQLTHYFKKGGHTTAPTPTDLALNLHSDGTWTWGVNEGTWEVSQISDADWEKWGIRADFEKKIVFHGWPYGGVDTTVDGPVEESRNYVDYVWAVYDAEPPAAPDSAQDWLRFAAGPYTPKEEEIFSELNLVGKWGIHAPGVVFKGREGGREGSLATYEWEVKFATTTILELNADNTWAFGKTSGRWKILPIEGKDWEKWDLEYYGPKKKLVLEGWENEIEEHRNIADGPIEASSGQVDFFWVNSRVTFEETQETSQMLQLKFRPYESASSYLTTKVIGAGKVTADDGRIICGPDDDSWGARRGRFFMRHSW
ncbi:hypothetical protein HYX10_05470 [Candidatus Woesearchaeota archaeon]|nr:hypothetical protein [Candidatus Woesearchaeota archaeon]